jgi:hypothetical protein
MPSEDSKGVCPESSIGSAVERNLAQKRLPSQKDNAKKLACESTIDSANRRSFIKNAALTTLGAAAAGGLVAGIDRKKLAPASSAKSESEICSCGGNFLSYICVGTRLEPCTGGYYFDCCAKGFFLDGIRIGSTFNAGLHNICASLEHVNGSYLNTDIHSACCLSAEGNLQVNGQAVVHGNLTTCSCLISEGNLQVKGGATIKDSLLLCGPIVGGSSATLLGAVTIGSTLTAAGPASIGTTASPTTTLQVSGSVSAKVVVETASSTKTKYKMSAQDFSVLVNALANTFTVTLPPANTAAGMVVFIKKTDSSSNAVTVQSSGSNTVEGTTSKPLKKQYDSLQLISNGTNEWFILGSSLCGAFTS